jgi:fumarylacetoacetate (FAA) hydrolase
VKLATLRDGSRDGRLIVVSRDGALYRPHRGRHQTLQQALDDWEAAEPELRSASDRLERSSDGAHEVVPAQLMAPLPRAFEWLDGSAYIHHIRLARRARGAAPPPELETSPLVYQGGSGVLLGARDPIELPNTEWGLDFEAEVAVVLGDVRRGIASAQVAGCIRLVMLCNDLSYRSLIPAELAKGFGFVTSKPATAFSLFAVTPDSLTAWRDGRFHGTITCDVNGQRVGQVPAGEGMHFSFHQLVAHIATTRALTAGTIVGSGTVSSEHESAGVGCLVEQRAREALSHGVQQTEFLKPGNTIRIDTTGRDGHSVFGAIEQEIVSA